MRKAGNRKSAFCHPVRRLADQDLVRQEALVGPMSFYNVIAMRDPGSGSGMTKVLFTLPKNLIIALRQAERNPLIADEVEA